MYRASQGQIEAIGVRREPAVEAFLASLVAQARAALGEVAFCAAEAGGRPLTCEEATAAAGAWLGP